MAPQPPARRLSDAAEGSPRFAESLALPDGLAGAGAALRTLAASLGSAALGPRAEFRDALRTRLVAVASVSPVGAAASLRPTDRVREWAAGWRVQRTVRTATAGLAAVLAISGVGLAGSRSLPGDPFYRIKRAAEDVQLALARGDVARGVRHLQFARERLHEVESLSGYHVPVGAAGTSALAVAVAGDRYSRISSALREMDKQTDAGARLLTAAYVLHHDAGALLRLHAFSESQATRLQGVLANLNADEQSPAIQSLSLVLNVQARATVLLGSALMDPNSPNVGPPPVPLGPAIPTLPTPTSPATRHPSHAAKGPRATGQSSGSGQFTGTDQTDHGGPAPTMAPPPTSSPSSQLADDDEPTPAPSSSPSPTPSPTSSGSSIVLTVPLPVPSSCVPAPPLLTICVKQG